MGRRRFVLGLALAALAAACGPQPMPASRTPKLDSAGLTREVSAIAERVAPARLGAGLLNLESGEVWSHLGEDAFPMQSVFKAPLGAAVLAAADQGRLSLDGVIEIGEADLSPQHSPIARLWPTRTAYTVRELLAAAVSGSDNTAADVLMSRIGGPGAVTAWLVEEKVAGVRIDRYERQLQMDAAGLPAFRPAWKDGTPIAAIPQERRRAALTAYLIDPRDTATPHGMLNFLGRIEHGELVSPEARRLLLHLMTDTPAGAGRIKAGLPPGSALAHKTGTARPDQGMSPVVNDAGIATLPDGRRYAMVVFLSGCRDELARCEAVLAEVTRALVKGAR